MQTESKSRDHRKRGVVRYPIRRAMQHLGTALQPAARPRQPHTQASRRCEKRASRPLDAFKAESASDLPQAANGALAWLRRACSRTGQRWVRTGPMAGVTVTRYDALR